jgi:hypothetical protein
MPKTRLFISHSSPEAPALTRLTELNAQLSDLGYEVLLDRTFIRSGDEWRNRIHVMLAGCQAAIILLDAAALASPWVLKESTILSWRKDLEGEEFYLHPVRFRGITEDDLKTRQYSPLLLTEVQHIIADNDVGMIAAAVNNVIPTHSEAPTLLDLIVSDMAAQIEHLTVSDLTLENICRKREPGLPFTPGESRRRRFASVLARRLLETGPECVSAAVGLFDEFGPGAEKEIIGRLAGLIAPLWVDSEAAALLRVAAGRKSDIRDLAIFCSRPAFYSDFVARDYIRRALLRSSLFWEIYVDDGHAGDVAQYVAGRIRDAARKLRRYKGLKDSEIDEGLNDHGSKDPIFAVLPSVVDDEALTTLREMFPRVTFVMRTDASGQGRPSLAPGVRYADPELSAAIEQHVLAGYDRLDGLLEKLT